MFLEILRPLERLTTEVAFVWLEWNVNANMRGDVVAFYGGCPTCTPLAGKVEVVGALTANMAFADMILISHVSCVSSLGRFHNVILT